MKLACLIQSRTFLQNMNQNIKFHIANLTILNTKPNNFCCPVSSLNFSTTVHVKFLRLRERAACARDLVTSVLFPLPPLSHYPLSPFHTQIMQVTGGQARVASWCCCCWHPVAAGAAAAVAVCRYLVFIVRCASTIGNIGSCSCWRRPNNVVPPKDIVFVLFYDWDAA